MTREALFIDRDDAARTLLPLLLDYKNNTDAVVLGLPRGGMIVAKRIAEELHLPLDFVVVKKVPSPANEELALGAVSEDGINYFDWELIKDLDLPNNYIDEVAEKKLAEAKVRARAYRGLRPPTDLQGKIAILVDDGIATGASMSAAASVARERGARKIIVAVPVASTNGFRSVKKSVDDIVCPCVREPFGAVGELYSQFPQIEDKEVIALLKQVS